MMFKWKWYWFMTSLPIMHEASRMTTGNATMENFGQSRPTWYHPFFSAWWVKGCIPSTYTPQSYIRWSAFLFKFVLLVLRESGTKSSKHINAPSSCVVSTQISRPRIAHAPLSFHRRVLWVRPSTKWWLPFIKPVIEWRQKIGWRWWIDGRCRIGNRKLMGGGTKRKRMKTATKQFAKWHYRKFHMTPVVPG